MQVVIQSRQPDVQALRDWVETRLRFATQRQAGSLSRAVVRFKDLNGPRGGVDKHCQIRLSTTDGGLLVATWRGETWRAALDQALTRATQGLSRRIGIRKSRRATSPARQLPAQEPLAGNDGH